MARDGRVRKLLFLPTTADTQRIQAGAALLVANLVVAGAALYSSFSPRRTEGNSLP